MNNLFEEFLADGTNAFGMILLPIIMLQMTMSFMKAFKRNTKEKCSNKVIIKNNTKRIKNHGNYAVSEITAIFIMIGGSQYIAKKEASLCWMIVLDLIVISLFVIIVGKMRLLYTIVIVGLTTVSLIVSLYIVPYQGYRWNDSAMMQSAGIYFVVFLLIDLILNKQNCRLTSREWLILTVEGLISIIIIFFLLKIENSKQTLISIFGVLFNYGILIYLVFRMKETQYREQEYLKIVKANDLQKQYMESVYQMDEQARRVRHDMKNHINTMNMLLNDDKNGLEKTRKYLAQYADHTTLMREYVKSKNQVVNAVINAKLMYCSEHDINTSVSVDQNIERLNDVELCCVLGNLLDNAIEAELKNPKENRFLSISMIMHEEVMEILIKNRILNSVLAENKELKTTKSGMAQHGIGMQNVREIVYQYDGYIDIYEEGNFFCCEVRI